MMYKHMTSQLARFGYLEGLAYLLFLFVAMPLKYWFGLRWLFPILMTLFLLALVSYWLLLLLAMLQKTIPTWAFVFGFCGALLPFGPFVFDQIVFEPKRQDETTKQ